MTTEFLLMWIHLFLLTSIQELEKHLLKTLSCATVPPQRCKDPFPHLLPPFRPPIPHCPLYNNLPISLLISKENNSPWTEPKVYPTRRLPMPIFTWMGSLQPPAAAEPTRTSSVIRSQTKSATVCRMNFVCSKHCGPVEESKASSKLVLSCSPKSQSQILLLSLCHSQRLATWMGSSKIYAKVKTVDI